MIWFRACIADRSVYRVSDCADLFAPRKGVPIVSLNRESCGNVSSSLLSSSSSSSSSSPSSLLLCADAAAAAAAVEPAKKWIICISQFIDAERSAIVELIKVLGATYTEALRKVSTTHLVLLKNEGQKYEKASEWGIECVDKAWLLRIAYGDGGNSSSSSGGADDGREPDDDDDAGGEDHSGANGCAGGGKSSTKQGGDEARGNGSDEWQQQQWWWW
jgi:hypothetical protein